MNKTFSRLALIATLALSGLAAGAATPFPKDGSPITSGTLYDVVQGESYKATFTPKTSGTLVQNGCPELKLDDGDAVFLGFTDMGQRYGWTVNAGQQYVITDHTYVMSTGQVMFVMESDMGVEATSILPEAGSVLFANANLTGEVLIRFNTGVEYDIAELCAGKDRIEIENTSIYGSEVALGITSAMNTLYANGTFTREGGQSLSIEISGLRTSAGVKYNGDGRLKLEYIAGPKLTDLISSTIPSNLKSYYPAGDPEGIWTMVFDRNVVNDGSIYMNITCGNPMSEGLYYNEIIYPKVDGATLTFDVTDKKRELDDYLMVQDVRGVEVKVNNVHDTDGNLAAGSGQGNVGSYSYSLTYNYIKPQTVVCEFDPPTGSSLEGVDEIEIWYNNSDLITADGVEFNYHTDEGFKKAIVLNSELQRHVENNEMTIRVKVPQEVKGHEQITVSLYNQQALDGNKYRIEAQYDMFVVNLLAPITPGQAIASTGTEDFVFAINQTIRYFYLRYDFYNAPGPEGWVYGSELRQQENGTWTAYNGDFPCYNDYNPLLRVYAYYTQNDYDYGMEPAETYEFRFVGTSEPFSYSDVKFVSIDPEPNTPITDIEDFCFTVTYDGLVRIDSELSGIMKGMGLGVEPFDRIEPDYLGDTDPVEGLAPVWRLYPPQWLMEKSDFIDISIFAKDEQGKVVEGNMGALDMDCLQFSYQVGGANANLRPLTVIPVPFTEVAQLDSFVFSYDGLDVSINYSYTDDVPVRIIDYNWEIIKELKAEDFESVDNGDGTFALKVAFEPITTLGTYTLFVPEKFFLIGDQFDVSGNESLFVDYNVTGSNDGIASILGDGHTLEIYNLQGMRVDASKIGTGVYIVDGKKVYIRK